jgi:muramoyltetrapeptide carboxypeptidase
MTRSARIDVIAPSGALLSREAFDAGLARLRALGFAVRSRVPTTPWMRFADTDDGRLAQIHAAASATDVDAVMIARGGYGVSRLLDRIDWELLGRSVRRGVRWIGFSDFTALQLGLLASAGASSWTGPAVCGDFGTRDCDPYTLDQFRSLLAGAVPVVEWEEASGVSVEGGAVDSECIEGVLWGGNLSIVASLAGTRWMPQVEGGLLFVEDVAEHPYRVERMLLQLLHAGVLARQRAILFGAFTEWKAAAHDGGFDLGTVGRYVSDRLGIPVIHGLPFGHVPRRATLGLGLRYRLGALGDAGAGAASRFWRLEALDSAVTGRRSSSTA